MSLSDADRTEIREHLHQACAVLDRDPAYHWLEDRCSGQRVSCRAFPDATRGRSGRTHRSCEGSRMTMAPDCFAAIDDNKITFLTNDLGREIFSHAGDPWSRMRWKAYRPAPGMFEGGLNVKGGDPAFLRKQLAHLQRVAGDIGVNIIELTPEARTS